MKIDYTIYVTEIRLAYPYLADIIRQERKSTDMGDINVPEYMLEEMTEEGTKRFFSITFR